MRIDILTVLPEMIEGFFDCSIMARAKKKGLAEIVIHNIRDYTTDKHRRTDDYPFGGCAGMVMKIEPIDNLITKLNISKNISVNQYSKIQLFTTRITDNRAIIQQEFSICSLFIHIIYNHATYNDLTGIVFHLDNMLHR